MLSIWIVDHGHVRPNGRAVDHPTGVLPGPPPSSPVLDRFSRWCGDRLCCSSRQGDLGLRPLEQDVQLGHVAAVGFLLSPEHLMEAGRLGLEELMEPLTFLAQEGIVSLELGNNLGGHTSGLPLGPHVGCTGGGTCGGHRRGVGQGNPPLAVNFHSIELAALDAQAYAFPTNAQALARLRQRHTS